jgi:CheY-like chemotaxis protein
MGHVRLDMVPANRGAVLIDRYGLALRNLLGAALTATLTSMPPLSLLFSSDEETSRVLIQALRELEFEVEHCSEIFAAVQRLTSRKLEVIVADWDDGLEASFLLKTSRELKSNNAAFTVAVVSGREAEAAARHLSVDCVLIKPFTVEQSKYALLTCDAFLAQMREWLPKILDSDRKRLRNPSPHPPLPTQECAPGNFQQQVERPVRSVVSGPRSVLWKYSEKAK